MVTIDIEDAQGELAGLLARVKQGEEVFFQEAGRPVYRIEPLGRTAVVNKKPVRFGLGEHLGLGPVPEDFDRMFEKEIDEMFNGPEPSEPVR